MVTEPPFDWIEVWAEYAKDRFNHVSERVDEFRNRARQLATAVAVIIGIELTLFSPAPSHLCPTYSEVRKPARSRTI